MSELFIVDAKTTVKINYECMDEIIKNVDEIIIDDKPTTKLRRNYKYSDGSKNHYKDINYAKSYYDGNKKTVRCENCNSPVLVFSLKRHMTSSKCLNNKI